MKLAVDEPKCVANALVPFVQNLVGGTTNCLANHSPDDTHQFPEQTYRWGDMNHVAAHDSVPLPAAGSFRGPASSWAWPGAWVGAHVQHHRGVYVAVFPLFDGGHDVWNARLIVLAVTCDKYAQEEEQRVETLRERQTEGDTTQFRRI